MKYKQTDHGHISKRLSTMHKFKLNKNTYKCDIVQPNISFPCFMKMRKILNKSL